MRSHRRGQALYLELHGADPVEDLAHVLADHGPGDLVVTLGSGLHGVACHVVEGDHVGQDAHCLVEGTKPRGKERIITRTAVANTFQQHHLQI